MLTRQLVCTKSYEPEQPTSRFDTGEIQILCLAFIKEAIPHMTAGLGITQLSYFRSNKHYASCLHQNRTHPTWVKAKQLLDTG